MVKWRMLASFLDPPSRRISSADRSCSSSTVWTDMAGLIDAAFASGRLSCTEGPASVARVRRRGVAAARREVEAHVHAGSRIAAAAPLRRRVAATIGAIIVLRQRKATGEEQAKMASDAGASSNQELPC